MHINVCRPMCIAKKKWPYQQHGVSLNWVFDNRNTEVCWSILSFRQYGKEIEWQLSNLLIQNLLRFVVRQTTIVFLNPEHQRLPSKVLCVFWNLKTVFICYLNLWKQVVLEGKTRMLGMLCGTALCCYGCFFLMHCSTYIYFTSEAFLSDDAIVFKYPMS